MDHTLPGGFVIGVVPCFEHPGRYCWSLLQNSVVVVRAKVSYETDGDALVAAIGKAAELSAQEQKSEGRYPVDREIAS